MFVLRNIFNLTWKQFCDLLSILNELLLYNIIALYIPIPKMFCKLFEIIFLLLTFPTSNKMKTLA